MSPYYAKSVAAGSAYLLDVWINTEISLLPHILSGSEENVNLFVFDRAVCETVKMTFMVVVD